MAFTETGADYSCREMFHHDSRVAISALQQTVHKLSKAESRVRLGEKINDCNCTRRT